MKILFRFGFLLIFLSGVQFALRAASSSYERAKELMEDDPLEADAQLSDTIKKTGNAKIRRAAKYDLFYLRLRLGRFSEAYPLATGKGMRSRLVKTAAAQFRTTEGKLSRVIAAIDAECRPDGEAEHIAEILTQTKSSAAVYDFALQRLEACKFKERLAIFPVLSKEKQQISDARLLHIYVLKARSLISAGEYETAQEGLLQIREAAADLIAQNGAFELPLFLAEARNAALQARADEVTAICKNISAREDAFSARKACLYLKGYALLKLQKYPEAAKILNALKAEPREIDNRLLKLTAAVASHQIPAAKLRKYTRRASYRYQARVLRELAAEIAPVAAEN